MKLILRIFLIIRLPICVTTWTINNHRHNTLPQTENLKKISLCGKKFPREVSGTLIFQNKHLSIQAYGMVIFVVANNGQLLKPSQSNWVDFFIVVDF